MSEDLQAKKAPPPIRLGQAAFWLGIALLVLVAVLGRYQIQRDGWNGASWRLDRWTSEVVFCGVPSSGEPFCRNLPVPS